MFNKITKSICHGWAKLTIVKWNRTQCKYEKKKQKNIVFIHINTYVQQWEKRTYEKAMWVSTTVAAVVDNVDEQLGIAFDRLFNYISGENDRGEWALIFGLFLLCSELEMLWRMSILNRLCYFTLIKSIYIDLLHVCVKSSVWLVESRGQ